MEHTAIIHGVAIKYLDWAVLTSTILKQEQSVHWKTCGLPDEKSLTKKVQI